MAATITKARVFAWAYPHPVHISFAQITLPNVTTKKLYLYVHVTPLAFLMLWPYGSGK